MSDSTKDLFFDSRTTTGLWHFVVAKPSQFIENYGEDVRHLKEKIAALKAKLGSMEGPGGDCMSYEELLAEYMQSFAKLEAMQKERDGYAQNAAFYRSCALSGECPTQGAEPFTPDQIQEVETQGISNPTGWPGLDSVTMPAPEIERVKAAFAIFTGHSDLSWDEAWKRSGLDQIQED